jgi:pimeloyl-ACP methyl ester carboxylesterase
LEVGERLRCRAVVALAPPLPEAMTREYRRWLARTSGWSRWRVLLPPEGVETAEAAGFELDSPRVGLELSSGRPGPQRVSIPVLVVAGRRDSAVDPEALREAAKRIGGDFLVREAGHWDLLGAGFERQVDPIHRWLVRTAGAELLRLTGFEDLEDD